MPLLRNKIYIAISAYPGISWLSSRNMQEHPLVISVKNRSKKIGAGCANCRWKPFTLTYWKPWREIRVKTVASLWYNQHAQLAPHAQHLHTGRRQQRTLFAQQGAKTNDGDLSTRPVPVGSSPRISTVTHVSCRNMTSGTEPPFQIPWLTKRNKSVVSPFKNSCIHSVRHLATYRHSNLVTLGTLQLIVTDFAVRIIGNNRKSCGA